MEPQILKDVMSSGLLSFPVTDFDKDFNFNPKGYAERLEWLAPYGASALFAAGGSNTLHRGNTPPLGKTPKSNCF